MTDLASRYGTRRHRRWLWAVVVTFGLGLGIAWAAWVAFQPRPVTAELYGYDVVDDRTVEIKLNVHRPDPVAVRCTVYAQGQDHSVVGEKTVDLPPGERRTTRVVISVETEQRAVTGVLRTCQTAD